MPIMRGLTIIVSTADAERFDAALAIASAHAALGGRARIFCHDRAVLRLEPGDMIATARDLGIVFIACQTGLANAGLPLPDFAEAGGMVSLLAGLEDDRLIAL